MGVGVEGFEVVFVSEAGAPAGGAVPDAAADEMRRGVTEGGHLGAGGQAGRDGGGHAAVRVPPALRVPPAFRVANWRHSHRWKAW